MQLDNQEIVQGDSVYDILEGVGEVTVTTNTAFYVTYGNNVRYQYDSTGNRKGNTPNRFPRMVYWHNPVVMLPTKDELVWDKLKQLFVNAYSLFG